MSAIFVFTDKDPAHYMDYYLIIYFVVGALEDFLATLTARYIAKEKAGQAAFLSFFTTVVTLAVFYSIFTFFDAHKSVLAIIVYALGISVGTYLAMKFNPELRNIFKTSRKIKKKEIKLISPSQPLKEILKASQQKVPIHISQ